MKAKNGKPFKTMEQMAKEFFEGGWRISDKDLFIEEWGDVFTDDGIEEIFSYFTQWESK